jgi:signal transduction histidine kinase
MSAINRFCSLIPGFGEAGARAYLLKSDASQYLITAVESLASHKPFFTGKVSEQLLDTFLAKEHDKLDAALSPRERVIVQLIAEGHSNREMTEILNLSVKTIETHTSFLPAILFLPLPLVLWAAVRFGEKGASGAILVVAVILTWATLHGRGLFPGEEPERSVLALQLFLTGLSIPMLMLGALIDELRSAERTTRGLAASLVRAQDQERRRITRDLHDSSGQHLIAATLIASRIEKTLPAVAQSTLRQLEDMLQQSIRDVRTVSYLLHPPLLDETGLGLALRHYIEGSLDRSSIAVELDISPSVERLAPDTELVLFRVVQEALTNISRHSKSPTAQIHLMRERATNGGAVVLTIEDAGKGVPGVRSARQLVGQKDAPTRGVGLASMRERLQQIGGRLEIDSVVGRTTVKAVVPIRD